MSHRGPEEGPQKFLVKERGPLKELDVKRGPSKLRKADVTCLKRRHSFL